MKSIHALSREQGGLCFYCECETWVANGRGRTQAKEEARWRFGIVKGMPGSRWALARRQATIEHLKRKTDGGKNNPENLRMACHECNSARGAIPVEEWRELRRPRERRSA